MLKPWIQSVQVCVYSYKRHINQHIKSKVEQNHQLGHGYLSDPRKLTCIKILDPVLGLGSLYERRGRCLKW